MSDSQPTSGPSDPPLSDNDNGDQAMAVSLANEIELLRDCVAGVRTLVDIFRHGDAEDEDLVRIPHACSAFLSLMEARIKEVVTVITDPNTSPALIAAPHNLVTMGPTTDEVSDLLLPLD